MTGIRIQIIKHACVEVPAVSSDIQTTSKKLSWMTCLLKVADDINLSKSKDRETLDNNLGKHRKTAIQLLIDYGKGTPDTALTGHTAYADHVLENLSKIQWPRLHEIVLAAGYALYEVSRNYIN